MLMEAEADDAAKLEIRWLSAIRLPSHAPKI